MKSKVLTQIFRITIAFVICAFCTANVYATEEKVDQSTINTKAYYYNQLTYLEKEIYDKLMDYKESFWNNENIIFEIGQYSTKEDVDLQAYIKAVMRARKAYIADNPEVPIWYLKSVATLKVIDRKIFLDIKPNAETGRYADFDSREIKEAIQEFETKASEFAKTLKGTDEQKLKQIYDWIIKTTDYDDTLSLPNTSNAYGAIIQGKSICNGFATSYKYIADIAELKVIYVTGYIQREKDSVLYEELHAWNMAYVDGRWVQIDTTFGNYAKGSTKYLFTPLNDGVHHLDTLFEYPKN